jgi:hypothetical protein
MAEKIKLVQGDTRPQIALTLTEETTEQPIDLTGATITLHMRVVGSNTLLFSRQGVVDNGTPELGKGYILWQPGDLDIPSGEYEGEIEIYWPQTGARQTVYDLLKFKVREDIA